MLCEGEDAFNVRLLDLSFVAFDLGNRQFGARPLDHFFITFRINRFFDDEGMVVLADPLLKIPDACVETGYHVVTGPEFSLPAIEYDRSEQLEVFGLGLE